MYQNWSSVVKMPNGEIRNLGIFFNTEEGETIEQAETFLLKLIEENKLEVVNSAVASYQANNVSGEVPQDSAPKGLKHGDVVIEPVEIVRVSQKMETVTGPDGRTRQVPVLSAALFCVQTGFKSTGKYSSAVLYFDDARFPLNGVQLTKEQKLEMFKQYIGEEPSKLPVATDLMRVRDEWNDPQTGFKRYGWVESPFDVKPAKTTYAEMLLLRKKDENGAVKLDENGNEVLKRHFIRFVDAPAS